MNVLFLTAELAPYTKVGGLGDVSGVLPRVLRRTDPQLDVRVFTPMHGRARARLKSAPSKVASARIWHPAGEIPFDAWHLEDDGVPTYFLTSPVIDEEGPVYHADAGWDAHRFVAFSLAALELARTIGFDPDVVHAHDWHTAAAIAAVHRDRFAGHSRGRASTVLTVHNLPYVGWGADEAMRAFGLVPGVVSLLDPSLAQLPLPIGLALSDRITTVSPGYAQEILEPEEGAGLEGLLYARADVLTGILNGLDLDAWDPRGDRELASPFDVTSLERRFECQRALRREVGLPEADVPVFGVVSRFVHQKGLDLVPEAVHRCREGFQLVVLGSGDPDVEDAFRRLAEEQPDQVRLRVGFDEGFARRVYAGADFLLIPSRYEPCGLTQMIAMRYGCVPVARETGGLRDTVRDLDLSDAPTGFLFPVASSSSVRFAMRRAIATWRRAGLRELQTNGMREDFSWTRAATMYARVYRDAGQRESSR
jgi:starch synthase